MTVSRHLANASINITKCVILRDDVLVTKNNGFLDLDMEIDSKIIIDCYNKKKNFI